MNIALILGFNAFGLLLIYIVLSRRLNRAVGKHEFMRSVRRELEGMVTDLNGTTERNLQLVEERVRRLQSLLRAADNSSERLRSAVDASSTSIAHQMPHQTPSGVQPHQSVVPGGDVVARQHSPHNSRRQSDVQPSTQAQARGSDGDERADDRHASDGRVGEQPAEYQRSNEQVIELYRQGLEPPAIALRLQCPLAEVELILRLDNRPV